MKTPNAIETETRGGSCAPAPGSASWLGGKTCADAKRLRKMIRKNGDALLRTAPLIVEAIEDDDVKFALEELANAESQMRGLRDMLEHARRLKIALVGEEDDWPNAQVTGAAPTGERSDDL